MKTYSFIDQLVVLIVTFVLLFVNVATLNLNNTADNEEEKRYEYCHRQWPEISLFVPVALKNDSVRNSEWSDVFLHSLTMFWPIGLSNTSLLIMLDSEMRGSELQYEYVDKIIEKSKNQTNFPQIFIKYHEPKITYKSGHDRQQHVMFYADQYTDAEYIGFGDSDCLFFTNIDREDVFEDEKPVVHGRIGYIKKIEAPKSKWPTATLNFLGMEQTMICMSYFPVIIKATHLKEMREYMERLHKASFDEIFLAHGSGQAFSQFNIMCTYLWNKHKDEYKWYIHDNTPVLTLLRCGDNGQRDKSLTKKCFLQNHLFLPMFDIALLRQYLSVNHIMLTSY
jgi:hypothetical protein